MRPSETFHFPEGLGSCILRVEMKSPVSFMIRGAMALWAAFGFPISAYAAVSPEDWRFYARSEFGSYWYDGENIDRLPAHLLRVRQKLVLSDQGKMNLAAELGKEYEKAYQAIILRELDCLSRKSRILELTFCSKEGEVIKRESYHLPEWDSISPDSVDDVLYGSLCQ